MPFCGETILEKAFKEDCVVFEPGPWLRPRPPRPSGRERSPAPRPFAGRGGGGGGAF